MRFDILTFYRQAEGGAGTSSAGMRGDMDNFPHMGVATLADLGEGLQSHLVGIFFHKEPFWLYLVLQHPIPFKTEWGQKKSWEAATPLKKF